MPLFKSWLRLNESFLSDFSYRLLVFSLAPCVSESPRPYGEEEPVLYQEVWPCVVWPNCFGLSPLADRGLFRLHLAMAVGYGHTLVFVVPPPPRSVEQLSDSP